MKYLNIRLKFTACKHWSQCNLILELGLYRTRNLKNKIIITSSLTVNSFKV
jgi:hypothetical protein